jgi:UDP-N-acetylmuramate dehydrogenase
VTAPPSIEIVSQASLKGFNSLSLPSSAEFFCSVTDEHQIQQALDYARDNDLTVTPLGGGSNLVLAGDIAGLVIYLDLKGISCHEFDSDVVHISLAAGENWHKAVEYCLEQGWYGLENLSLIPGNIGAAPIQNIGAYGVELRDYFISLKAIDISTGEVVVMDKQACEFGYRDSIFKQALNNRFLITEVTLALSTRANINIGYPALAEALGVGLGQDASTPKMVSAAVCAIRRAKLPDPEVIPNAGSFFKNPVVGSDALNELLKANKTMPHYPQDQGGAKIPAAWLIDQCEFKGLRSGNVGVHEHQALVLVNFGGTGTELLALAGSIQDAVQERFSIALEIEPRIYGLNE